MPDELPVCLAAGERALTGSGDLRASRESFGRAYELAEAAGEPEAMALAVLGLAGLWVGERRTATGMAMLQTRLQHALSLLGGQSSLALRIRARLAAEADYRHGTHDETLSVLAEARAAEDPLALAESLSLAHHCLLGPGNVTLRGELAAELIRLSFRTERRSDRLVGLLWQTADAYAAGDLHAGRLLGELRECDHAAVGFVISAIDVMLAIRAGRLDDAESLAAICADSGAAAGDIDAEWWPGAQLVTIRWYQGRLPELLPMLHERVHSPALSAVDNSTLVALTVAAAMDGDRPVAASGLAALRGRDLTSLPRGSSWLVTMNGIAEAAYLLGDAEVAREVYDVLLPYADLPMVGGLGVTCFGSTHQALGIAALITGAPERAADHLAAAVQHNLALPHWPALAFSRQRLARALRLRARAGDAAAAERELDTARAEAAALGIVLPGDGSGGGSAAATATCDRIGRSWRLGLAGRCAVVEDSIGMLHLAVLIGNPRREITAADLVAGVASVAGSAATGYDMAGDADQRVLDAEAIASYRSRLRRLDAELDKLAPGCDADHAARAEMEWLVSQLASATGLGHRPRSFPDDRERARVAVGKAIRRALARITVADPVIGEHLRRAVRTGSRCSYWPG
ncbi:MAG TPA: hypothetical protein VMC83_00685 [Streptosporangiaceae bacterium]|nr:hypothetical protein [Streptosporangiaceae bacterium]